MMDTVALDRHLAELVEHEPSDGIEAVSRDVDAKRLVQFVNRQTGINQEFRLADASYDRFL